MILITTLLLWSIVVYITYSATGLTRVREVYTMWFDKQYWVKRYNVVEALAWGGKLLVILPAIFFSYEVWWAHIITLVTSSLLIWVSEQKLLPTLLAFNTLWIGISSFILVRYFYTTYWMVQ